MKLNCRIGRSYPRGTVYSTRGIVEYIKTGHHPSNALNWGEPMNEKRFDDFMQQVFQPSYFTAEDFESMGMHVRYDPNGQPYLETPFGKCYLKELPHFKESLIDMTNRKINEL